MTTHTPSAIRLGLLAALLVAGGTARAQKTTPAPADSSAISAGPPYIDRPQGMNQAQYDAFVRAIRPYVDEARRTYPEARARAFVGLPEGSVFYVTTQLRDDARRSEQVFVAVRGFVTSTEGGPGAVWGTIANEIHTVSGYRYGQEVTVGEADIVDWTIVDAAGNEEGNLVGKFLDTYQVVP